MHEPNIDPNTSCDRCVAKAQWVASFLNGPLFFCNHHYLKANAGNRLVNTAIDVKPIKRLTGAAPQ